jgi:hypothetical protein
MGTLTAYFLIAAGSSTQGDLRFVLGLPLTVAGVAVAWWSAARRMPEVGPVDERQRGWIAAGLSALAAIGLVVSQPESAPWYAVPFRLYPAAAIPLIGVFAAGDASWRRRAVRAMIAIAVLVVLVTPLATDPAIDVRSWIETCTRALLRGVHPYSVIAVDPHHGMVDYGSTPTVFPYMPGILLAAAPAVALGGDYRVLLAICLPASVWLLRTTGRRLSIDPWLLDGLTLAFILQPRTIQLTADGFPEPFLVVSLAAFVFLAVRSPDSSGQGIPFMMMPALKQYVAAPVAIYAAWKPKAWAIGAAVAVATVLPFAIWNWRATVDGIMYLIRVPIAFRRDSNSLAALVSVVLGLDAPRWLAIAVQFVAGGVAWWLLRRRGLAGLLLASALALLSSFLVGTQAFPNYYYLGGAAVLMAALVQAGCEPAAR